MASSVPASVETRWLLRMAVALGGIAGQVVNRAATIRGLGLRMVFWSAVCGLASGCSHDGEWSLEAAGDWRQISTPDSAPSELVVSHSIGEGVLEDTRGAIGVSVDGLVAVEETSECRVSVFEIATGRLVYRVGRCGAGPGEIARAVSLFFLGDTLVVVDGGLNVLSRFDGTGRFLGRESSQELWGDLSLEISSVRPVGDRDFIAIGRRPARGEPQVFLVGREPGIGARRLVRQPRAVRRDASNQTFGVKACTTVWDTAPAFVVVGMHSFEVLAFDVDATPLWRTHTSLPWFTPILHEGTIEPSAYMIFPICGPSGVFVRVTKTPPYARLGTPFDGGYGELWSPAGVLLAKMDVPPFDETLFRPGGNWGDYWVFDDAISAVPQLRVYRLQEHGTGQRHAET